MAETTKKFQKWLVLSGSHHQNGIKYGKGQKFISDTDITRFNTNKHVPKYKLLGDATIAEILQFQAESGFSGTPPKHEEDAPVESTEKVATVEEPEETEEVPSDSLEAMTIAELKELAEDESIDLGHATRKDDIVAKIREARAE